MGTDWPVMYRIDEADKLLEMNAAWTAFAHGNGGAPLEGAQVVGRSLWDFVTDPSTRQLYRDMVKRLRQGWTPIRFQFRCDAPQLRRLLAMEMVGEGDGTVRFVVTSVAEQERPAVACMENGEASTDQIVTICGWCMRVPLPGAGWVEIEEALEGLGLFRDATSFKLSHGMCPDCAEAMMGMMEDPQACADGHVIVGELPN